MAAEFEFELITPENVIAKEKVTFVRCTSVNGELAFLRGHIPYVGALVPCQIVIELPDGQRKFFAVLGGFVHVDDTSKVQVAARLAYTKEDILNKSSVREELENLGLQELELEKILSAIEAIKA